MLFLSSHGKSSKRRRCCGQRGIWGMEGIHDEKRSLLLDNVSEALRVTSLFRQRTRNNDIISKKFAIDPDKVGTNTSIFA